MRIYEVLIPVVMKNCVQKINFLEDTLCGSYKHAKYLSHALRGATLHGDLF